MRHCGICSRGSTSCTPKLDAPRLRRRSCCERSCCKPHATLRYLQKPVDLIIIPDSEHVITNPGERMISQSSTVDWFRFWLKGEEDPDPTKAEQYKRWREFRLQK